MNRLSVVCRSCTSRVLLLEAVPAEINLMIDPLVKLATQMHGAFHQPGSQVQFDIKNEPIAIETAQIVAPPILKSN